MDLLTKLYKESQKDSDVLKNSLIVLDSMKDFLVYKDMTTDKDLLPIMDLLKKLRENGATVFMLHHTTKDTRTTQYKGTTIFRDSPDAAYEVNTQKDGNKLLYKLTLDKNRMNFQDVVFSLNTKTLEIESEYLDKLDLSKEDYELVEKVQLLLFDSYENLKQSDILEKLNIDMSEKKIRGRLKQYEDEYWTVTKKPKENNASYYTLINPLPKLLNPI